MRFAALFGKEFRECLPWVLLVAIVLLALGGFLLRAQAYSIYEWHRAYNSPGTPIEPYRLIFYSLLSPLGLLLFCSSIGLGLILGIRHFWIPHFTRTWLFLLHHSVDRSIILLAKLVAAFVALIVAIGPVWIGLFGYASRPELFTIPQPMRIFVVGWIFIILGFVVYLGTALTGLSKARWYTTKIVGLAFAAIVIFTTTMLSSLGWAFTVIFVSTATLLLQVFDTFLRREF